MPNIFTCDYDWFARLKDGEPKVIVASWSEDSSEKVNDWLERLQKLEEEQGVPVFVCDSGSCPQIAEKLGIKEAGETIVYQHGQEVGRLPPGEDLESDLGKVKELTKEG